MLPASFPDHGTSTDRRVEQVGLIIDADPAGKWTVERLARSCELSRFHFSRRFKHLTGFSVMAYVRSRRIELAKNILSTTRAPIKEIAAKCGFSNGSQFARDFRSVTSLTPRRFRDESHSV
jgi:AraC family transcriptional regulator